MACLKTVLGNACEVVTSARDMLAVKDFMLLVCSALGAPWPMSLSQSEEGAWTGIAGGVSACDTINDLRLLVCLHWAHPGLFRQSPEPHCSDGYWHV